MVYLDRMYGTISQLYQQQFTPNFFCWTHAGNKVSRKCHQRPEALKQSSSWCGVFVFFFFLSFSSQPAILNGIGRKHGEFLKKSVVLPKNRSEWRCWRSQFVAFVVWLINLAVPSTTTPTAVVVDLYRFSFGLSCLIFRVVRVTARVIVGVTLGVIPFIIIIRRFVVLPFVFSLRFVLCWERRRVVSFGHVSTRLIGKEEESWGRRMFAWNKTQRPRWPWKWGLHCS